MALISAFIQLAITWAQRTVSATRATVIYALEPVWAAVVGVFIGDQLGIIGFAGGALTVAAVLVTELRLTPRRSEERGVGKEGVSTWRFRLAPSHYKKTHISHTS